jgi:SMC interacting uncharacterized protein involved in chromosome segregation
LDETSGLLSEQKIKTLELEKKLESCRQGYDSKIQEITSKSERFQESVVTKLSDTALLINNTFDSKVTEQIIPHISGVRQEIDGKVDSLTKRSVRYHYSIRL